MEIKPQNITIVYWLGICTNVCKIMVFNLKRFRKVNSKFILVMREGNGIGGGELKITLSVKFYFLRKKVRKLEGYPLVKVGITSRLGVEMRLGK